MSRLLSNNLIRPVVSLTSFQNHPRCQSKRIIVQPKLQPKLYYSNFRGSHPLSFRNDPLPTFNPHGNPFGGPQNPNNNNSKKNNSLLYDTDMVVCADVPPFNIFYHHDSRYVMPVDPTDPGTRPLLACGLLLLILTGVFVMWQTRTTIPLSMLTYKYNHDLVAPGSRPNQRVMLANTLRQATSKELQELCEKAEWMYRHFTVNFESAIHRPYTLITNAFSHSDLSHLLGNATFLFLFMPKVYSYFGPRHFIGLYITGAIGCSLAQAGVSKLIGHTKKPLSYFETLVMEARGVSPQQMSDIASKMDLPALGASGSCMSIAAASALLFPKDRLFMRGLFIPVPLAVAFYIFSDLSGVTRVNNGEFSNVAHLGHLGGIVTGAAYVCFLWYSRRLGRISPYVRYKGSHLPLIELMRGRKNPITMHTNHFY